MKVRLAKLVVAVILIGSTFSVFAEVARYTITDLGSLDDRYSFSQGRAVNNHGQVTGQSKVFSSELSRDHDAPFITDTNGKMTELFPIEDGGAYPDYINDSGQVAGGMWNKVSAYDVFVTDSEGKMTNLSELWGESSFITGLNNSGQVTGYFKFGNVNNYTHAFVTDSNNNLIDLGTLGGHASEAYAINNRGQVVGTSDIAYLSYSKVAFVTDSDNKMIDLYLSSRSGRGYAYAINDSGQITGEINIGSNLNRHAFVADSDGKMVVLGSFGEGTTSAGKYINTSGQVAGSWKDIYGNGRAFVTDSDGKMIDLCPFGGEGCSVIGFNDNGQVLGGGGGYSHFIRLCHR